MHTSFHNLRYYIAAAGLLLVVTVSGDPPAWWSDSDSPVIDPSASPNNLGPANVGQAKWMAHSAIETLRPNDPGLAAEIEIALVGEGKIIRSLAPPANDADREKNHAPLLVGQLKNIATPFYDALHIADPVWLEAQLAENHTKDPIDSENYYPWTLTPDDDKNRAIATIGHLKAVFSLRFETLTTAATDSDHDGLPDRWEVTHFGNLNASGSGDSDSDGIDNAQERNLGTNPQNADSDDDGIMDGEDADPLDGVIDWRRTPEPSWMAWDLSNLNVASDWTLTDLSDNGTMLFTASDHSIRLVYELQTARTLANAPNSLFYTSPFSGILHGDRIFGRQDIKDQDGFIRTEWVYLDPSNNGVVNAGVHQNNPPELIWDATSLNVSGVGGGNTVELPESSFFYGTRFEANENAVAASTWSLFGYTIVKYWTYSDGEYDSGRLVPFPVVSRFTPETQTTATFRQTSPGEDEIIRHIIPSGSGVYVAPATGGFRESKIKIDKHALLQPFSATSQGWLIQVDEESVPKVWANGKWNLLRHLVGKDATGAFPESVVPVKICDNGQMVARIRYPSQQVEHYVLLVPATAIELAPSLVDDDEHVIPGSERPNHLLRDSDGNVLSRLSTINAMVERDPTPTLPLNQIQDASTRRIAWREINVKISKLLAGRTVTWSMTPRFTPCIELGSTTNIGEMIAVPTGDPRFRGSWAHAYRSENGQVDYRRSFSPSETYAAHDFAVKTATSESIPGTATTTVDAEGYTAIRVNVPPIGFNKARVSIQVEGFTDPLDILDLEVSAVVVIDPGHGGTLPATNAARLAAGYDYSPEYGWRLGGSSTNNSTAKPSNTLEKNMTLDFSRILRDRLVKLGKDNDLSLRIKMTRDTDENSRLDTRARFARNFGGDQLISVHFNGMDQTVRGCETHVDKTGNLNHTADMDLALRVNTAAYNALLAADSNAVNRNARSDRGLDVLSDPDLGNTTAYQVCRAVMIEAEFIDVAAVDQLLNTGDRHQTVRQAVMNSVADALILDIRVQPTAP